MEVMPDHVHLLVEVDPQLRREFPRLGSRPPTLWSNSYFVPVGGAPLAVIQQYVENQKKVCRYRVLGVRGAPAGAVVARAPIGSQTRSRQADL
jgi:REP element-mobilizing transposase RayT